MLFAAMLIASQEPSFVSDPKTASALRAYSQCLRMRAIELEPSGASPDDLFKAAKTACADEFVSASYALQERYVERGRAEAARMSERFIAAIEDPALEDVRLKVLERRATKKNDAANH
ncbi:hypothetical protein [Sphingomonas arenae]|uniref:hypothetical protein n=1 Tax=Sphingomonas arenae TaxID=2812555 RepID=UPI001966DD39|nr:hypothetical protein [Sphingomonas arenae]